MVESSGINAIDTIQTVSRPTVWLRLSKRDDSLGGEEDGYASLPTDCSNRPQASSPNRPFHSP